MGAFLAIRAGQDSWAGLVTGPGDDQTAGSDLTDRVYLAMEYFRASLAVVLEYSGQPGADDRDYQFIDPRLDLAKLPPGDGLSGLYLTRHTRSDFHRVAAGRGEAAGLGADHFLDYDVALGVASCAQEGFPLVLVDRLPDPGGDHHDRYPHGDRKLRSPSPSIGADICRLGPGMGDIWAWIDRLQFYSTVLWRVVAVPGDIGARRPTGAKLDHVLPAADIFIDRSILDPLVGVTTGKTAFRPVA